MIRNVKFSMSSLIAFSLIPFVSAQGAFGIYSIKDFVIRVIDSILEIFSPIFEVLIGPYSASEFFFAKILLLFLLIIICKYVLEKTPLGDGNERVSTLIAVIVSLLAIRFISENDLIEGILIPYGTLGVALTTILPLLIFFYFIHRTGVGSFGRKFFWAIFVIIFIVLWGYKTTEISEISNAIYGLTVLAAILLLIFDKSVHTYFGIGDLNKYEKNRNKKRIWEAKKELDELEEHFQNRRMGFKDYKEEKKRIKDYIKELSKE